MIGTIIKIIPAAIVLFAVYWFVQYQYNPGAWCQMHPDPEKSSHVMICEPFGFELEKGTILDPRPDDPTPFSNYNGATHNGLMEKKKVIRKDLNCEDSNVLMTREGYEYCIKNEQK